MDIRYSTDPVSSKEFDTKSLREHYLIEKLFIPGEASFFYCHIDRIIVGGIVPTRKALPINDGSLLSADYFFERREAGIINIGGRGAVVLDNDTYKLEHGDALYIGKGIRKVIFESIDEKDPAMFYLNSCPAHKEYESKRISMAEARKVEMGNKENLNVRTINQYIHPSVLDTCQLTMGMTTLKSGSVWNTMPCHTHARRMEVYLYFGMNENDRVFHLMGEPDETRHIVVSNGQAVISPSWSIHSGVGTGSYTFIWGMCGENIKFDDMDFVDMKDLM